MALNVKKQARREALEGPKGISQSNATFAGAPPAFAPQPRPMEQQSGKGGNIMNYPHQDNGQGQTGQRIGGKHSFMYGDMGLDVGDAQRRGLEGFVAPLGVSGEPQGLGANMGTKHNMGMNTHNNPKEEMARMLEGMHLINSALERGQALGSGNRPDGTIQPAPYQPGPMGMHNYPGPLDGGGTIQGQLDYQTPQQSQMSLGLQGMQSAEQAVASASGSSGMNMGTGQRNTKGKA